MKGSFQTNSANLDSGAEKAFSQESPSTSTEGNSNVMSHSLEHLHVSNPSLMHCASDRKDWLYES